MVTQPAPSPVVVGTSASPYRLYRPHQPGAGSSGLELTLLVAIPYFAWANRVASPMEVWLSTAT